MKRYLAEIFSARKEFVKQNISPNCLSLRFGKEVLGELKESLFFVAVPPLFLGMRLIYDEDFQGFEIQDNGGNCG